MPLHPYCKNKKQRKSTGKILADLRYSVVTAELSAELN
jgi:hypothetical protein